MPSVDTNNHVTISLLQRKVCFLSVKACQQKCFFINILMRDFLPSCIIIIVHSKVISFAHHLISTSTLLSPLKNGYKSSLNDFAKFK